MIDVLVTMRFDDSHLAWLRAVSPRLSVRREDAGEADYSGAEILYAGAPPRDLDRAPELKWVQLHLAGVDGLVDHPVSSMSGAGRRWTRARSRGRCARGASPAPPSTCSPRSHRRKRPPILRARQRHPVAPRVRVLAGL